MGRLGFAYFLGVRVRRDIHTDAIEQEERLWIADPKAIRHILQGTSYLYEKPHANREVISTLTDRGLGTVEGWLPLKSHVV